MLPMPAWLLLLLSLGFMMRATVVSGWEVVALPVGSREWQVVQHTHIKRNSKEKRS
jgi:hypothetical protein